MVTVPILDDNVDEDTEFFNLTLTSTDNAAMLNPSTATLSIEDSKLITTKSNLVLFYMSKLLNSVSTYPSSFQSLVEELDF